MTEVPRIRCRALTKRLPSGSEMLTILDTVDLEIAASEFVAIVGPSGSGKSTLLGLLAGLDRATEGSVEIDGTSLGDLDEDGLAQLRRDKIGFVFQSFQLLDNLTARENVLLPLELLGFDRASDRAKELLDTVGLGDRAHHYPAQLSGGEQQRVALARAFAARPPLLLADEPTGNLDPENGQRVLDLLLEMRAREGTTLVLVTHDLGIAGNAPRRIRLEGGRVVADERSTADAASASGATADGDAR